MEKNKRIIKILKFLLQVLVAAVTSWGTATGMSSPHEDPVQAQEPCAHADPVGFLMKMFRLRVSE